MEKNHFPYSSFFFIFAFLSGIKELVKIMCEGKVNLHPDVEVITVAEERKGDI